MPDWTAQSDPDLARITELIRTARRLGLVWGLRPGTVLSTSPPYTRREASVRMDGDEGGITVVSLVDDLVVGDRVMVVHVPPSGEYAIGLLNRPSSQLWTAASTSNSGTITTETVVLTIPSVSLKAGTAYRVEAGSNILAANTITAQFKVRKNNVAGSVWATSPNFPGVNALLIGPAWWTSFITPTVDVVDSLVLTMAATGAGAIHASTAAVPRFFSITPVGRSADFPQAVPVS